LASIEVAIHLTRVTRAAEVVVSEREQAMERPRWMQLARCSISPDPWTWSPQAVRWI
jgi:hypothetical protein